jgi:hypothetical protein
VDHGADMTLSREEPLHEQPPFLRVV